MFPSFLTWVISTVWSDRLHTYILALTFLYPILQLIIFSKRKSDGFITLAICQSTSVASHCFENKYQIFIMILRPCMIWPLPTFPTLFWTTPSPEPRMFPSHLAFSYYRAFEHVAATTWEYLYLSLHLDSLVAQSKIWSLGWEDPQEKGMAGYPLQYSCLENPMDRRAWQAALHRVTENWTQLSN